MSASVVRCTRKAAKSPRMHAGLKSLSTGCATTGSAAPTGPWHRAGRRAEAAEGSPVRPGQCGRQYPADDVAQLAVRPVGVHQRLVDERIRGSTGGDGSCRGTHGRPAWSALDGGLRRVRGSTSRFCAQNSGKSRRTPRPTKLILARGRGDPRQGTHGRPAWSALDGGHRRVRGSTSRFCAQNSGKSRRNPRPTKLILARGRAAILARGRAAVSPRDARRFRHGDAQGRGELDRTLGRSVTLDS